MDEDLQGVTASMATAGCEIGLAVDRVDGECAVDELGAVDSCWTAGEGRLDELLVLGLALGVRG